MSRRKIADIAMMLSSKLFIKPLAHRFRKQQRIGNCKVAFFVKCFSFFFNKTTYKKSEFISFSSFQKQGRNKSSQAREENRCQWATYVLNGIARQNSQFELASRIALLQQSHLSKSHHLQRRGLLDYFSISSSNRHPLIWNAVTYKTIECQKGKVLFGLLKLN